MPTNIKQPFGNKYKFIRQGKHNELQVTCLQLYLNTTCFSLCHKLWLNAVWRWSACYTVSTTHLWISFSSGTHVYCSCGIGMLLIHQLKIAWFYNYTSDDAVARLLTGNRRFESITPFLTGLQLNTAFISKSYCLLIKIINNIEPSYPIDLLSVYTPSRTQIFWPIALGAT